MKKFILSLLVVIIVPVVILLGVSYIKFGSWFHADFRLDPKVHIIAVGPSTLACALNNEHIEGFQNLSRLGTPYFAMIGPLERFLKANPQVDTVFVAFGRHAVYRYPGTVEGIALKDLRELLPFCIDNPDKEFKKGLFKNPNLYGAMLNPELIGFGSVNKQTPEDFSFSFYGADRTNLHNPHAHASTVKYDEQMARHGSNLYSLQWMEDSCALSLRMIEQAIETCKKHKAVPVLFCSPLYDYDRWYSMDGYYDYVKTLDPSLLIADYERFIFPDESYYDDVHHLNSKGADYFTKHIAERGMQCCTLGEYIKRIKEKPIGFVNKPL